jgi:hypothetical protein
LKSLGINIRNYRKLTKETRLGGVRELIDCELLKCKRNNKITYKRVQIKGNRKPTKCNEVTKEKVFRKAKSAKWN